MGNSLQHELTIYCIKCFDISFIGLCYLVLSFVFAILLDVIFHEDEDEKDKQTTLWLSLKIILQTVLIMLSVYAMRKIVKSIPFAFDGYKGFKHHRLLELNGVVILAFVLITLQSNYGYDLKLLASRFRTNVILPHVKGHGYE